MTSPLTEDEGNERMIRNLRKLPENRRCINCNSLGPQYVCIDFWTFICTTCSGIHREFNHRVKSVSFAKFTSQEVSSLQGGGNACAKEIYFKEWNTLHTASFPDPRSVIPYLNVRRLRYYIRDVYVDKRYIGGKSFDKRRDDRSPKNSDEDVKSPDSQRDQDNSSPPIMRPVRDILAEKVSPVRIIEPPKANGQRNSNRSESSSSLESSNKNPVAEVRTESSLIDFDTVIAIHEPPPPSTTQLPQLQHTTPSPAQTSTSVNNNWANFDSVQEMKTSHAPSNTNFLHVLSELSVPAPISHSTVSPGGVNGGQRKNVRPQENLFPVTGNQAEVKSTAKKELPEGLFTLNDASFAASQYRMGFHNSPHGMEFNMLYNIPMFPSVAPLQGASPNMAPPSDIHRASSLGTFSPAWISSQSSIIKHAGMDAKLPTRSSHQSSVSPQLLLTTRSIHGTNNSNMPPQPRPHIGSYRSNNTSFRSLNRNQQQSGGNPFG